MSCIPCLMLLLAITGQAPADQPEPGKSESTARLNYMKKSVADYELHATDAPGTIYTLREDPALRFSNAVGDAQDGAIFLWVDDVGRPAASVQVFPHPGLKSWLQEFSSLSPRAISAGEVWETSKPGVEFQTVPDAPKPAKTPRERLSQMRMIAETFVAEDQFEEKSWEHLRLLTTPLARYGKEGTNLSDGALFAYVLTTDPEVYLMLEARNGKNGPEWQYGFAPMSVFPLKASWKGREVWTQPYRKAWATPREPFYVHNHSPLK